jgi:hypothetical protein
MRNEVFAKLHLQQKGRKHEYVRAANTRKAYESRVPSLSITASTRWGTRPLRTAQLCSICATCV